MMHKILSSILSLLLMGILTQSAMALTGPSTSGQDSLRIFVNSGTNELIYPVDHTGADVTNVTALSSDTETLEVLQVLYETGNSFAIIEVLEKGSTGVVTLDITAETDTDPLLTQWNIHIVNYNNPGINFEIHDIVFWQEVIPVDLEPIFDTVVNTGEAPYDHLNYDDIPLTVNLDCVNSPPCTGYDFFTSFFRGYLVPPTDGTYHLYIQSGDRRVLFLSDDENFDNAEMVAARSNAHGDVGEEIGNNTTKSIALELEGGKVYAMYATKWIIHNTMGGIMWTGPGVDEPEFIPGEYMMPVFDTERPTAVTNLMADWVASEQMQISWDESTDNSAIRGYNIYVDGFKINEMPVTNTEHVINGLTPSTTYQVLVTAVDRVNNESLVSNTLTETTFQIDENAPTAPTELNVVQATGLAMKIQWSGASDAETEVLAYDLYLDGELYNAGSLIYGTETTIYNLRPQTSYSVELIAYDAGFNPSDMSETFAASTVEFDPLGESLGERRGKMVVNARNISWNNGIGINGPYNGGGAMVNDENIRNLVVKMGAGAIRWGAIDANSISFADGTGTDHANTHAKMLDFAIELDAYYALCVGVEPGIDYRNDPNTFLYLLEYLAGDASTTWGAVRASEGYTEPLLQESKGILLEFGNEVWGGSAHDAHFDGGYEEYRQWARDMSEVVKSSPYYDPDKITMVYSGRYPHPNNSFGVNTDVLTGDRGEILSLGVSGYLGGNLNYDPEIPAGESELDYYKNGMERVATNIEGFILTMQEMLELTGSMKSFYLYESNMTTSSYNGRFGQAITMIDYFASSMEYGSVVPSIFHLTGGQWRITRPTENYKELPLFTTAQYFNRFSKGHVLETEFVTNDVITNHNDQVIDFDPVGAYAYINGENYSLVLINRDFENDYTVQMELPGQLGIRSNAKIYTIYNDDFSSFESNIDSVNVYLQSGDFIEIPKHSMVLIAAVGTDPQFEQLPIGYFDRVRPESLEVTVEDEGMLDENREVIAIEASVLPEDVFSGAVMYEILENDTESDIFYLSGNRMRVRGSGKTGDEGTIRIRAYASDNNDLEEIIVIQVSNQGATSVEDLLQGIGTFFYPNPASDQLTINENLNNNSVIEIFDINGRKVVDHVLSTGYSIDIGELQAGFYFIRLIMDDGNVVRGKLQVQ